MDPRTVREKRDTLGLPAGTSGVMSAGLRDRTAAFLFCLQRQQRELEELSAKKEERKQVLESLQQRLDEMHKKLKEVAELHSGFDMFLKDDDADQAAEKAEKVSKEKLQKEAEIRRLKEEDAELMERKQKLQRRVQRHSVYQDFMEQVVKMTKFKDVQLLTGHLESLVHFKEELSRRESEAQEQADQWRKALRTLEDQHHLLQLHKNNQLSQLQSELEETLSETLTWEREWNHIQGTAAKKTLLLGQIKMATLNLYEGIDDKVEGEEGVDMNDTEKQLDKVKMNIQDYVDMVTQHQTPSSRCSNGETRKEWKRDMDKKSIATHRKKD
ncbi:Coiled-coil domain-containing protein 42-like protein [Nibea albiflora]|uniref:Coiled-coil domain-containing protein 42-like protein n=1 Tax=Nibea albiflora TaxID=240163 RepID=A0ACB7FDG1_NIBAL|nr:Coiled-coil domain-containing protein 42-like protein [Nibea albiflora]